MKIIGRKETVFLPQLGSGPVLAKIDTGAYRSAVHCQACKEVKEGEKTVLKAQFEFNGKKYEYDFFDFKQKMVRSSFGDSELRYCVKLKIKLGRKTITSEVSLSNRSDMRNEILIGRKTLRGKFLVDVSKSHLLTKPSKTN
jgi:hypothetical protein